MFIYHLFRKLLSSVYARLPLKITVLNVVYITSYRETTAFHSLILFSNELCKQAQATDYHWYSIYFLNMTRITTSFIKIQSNNRYGDYIYPENRAKINSKNIHF